MFFRIFKKDLKRKKTTNLILFLFIILTTLFVASGINNVVTVMNGTDYYLDKADIGDYVLITMGENAVGCLDDMLNTEIAVNDYRLETVVFSSYENVTLDGNTPVKGRNNSVFQALSQSSINFFDKDNKKITDVTEGHTYATGRFMSQNNLKIGDTIYFELNGVKLELILDGVAKDALLGSNFIGNIRFLLSDKDMQKLLDDDIISNYYAGEICYIKTDDINAMSSATSKVSNLALAAPRSTFNTSYIMEMLVAFMMLLLSIALIIVSFVVLKFSISFTISEEFREIGVMKAIGISNKKIRSLYIIKYLVMAIIGAVIGFFASIPFGKLLLNSVSEIMVLGNSSGLLINALGSLLVVILILLFAYHCTKKVEKTTPLDAIRSGQSGERYKNKSVLRIKNCPLKNTSFLAINDILSNPRRYLTIMISIGICTLFMLIMVNVCTTINSPSLITCFVTKSDLYITNNVIANEMLVSTKENMLDYLDELADTLTNEDMPSSACVEIQYKYPATFNGNDYLLPCQQGLHTNISDYEFTKGLMPTNANEIAITPQISEITGAKIGDIITIHFGDEDIECMVTAYFQTMNNLGEIVRLHEDAPTDFSYISSIFSFQINFLDDVNDKEIETRKERIKELYNNQKVMNRTEYSVDSTNVLDTLESVKALFVGITLTVVVLITILMERNFIADEKSQIATLKAIGFSDGKIIKWQSYRFLLVTFVAVIIAGILSVPLTNLFATPIFGMLGTTNITYNIEPHLVFVFYPSIVLVLTVVLTYLVSLYIKTITSRDTANIE